MTRQVPIQSESPNGKTQSLLTEKPTETTIKLAKTTTTKEGQGEKVRKTNRFGEVAGGTAAECAAVCCCCPCTLMNLLVLAIYKMPACLCRKAKNRHRLTKKKRQGLLAPINSNNLRRGELEREVKAAIEKQKGVGGDRDHDGETEAVHLEKEMWDQFCETGFWRSPSQRQTI